MDVPHDLLIVVATVVGIFALSSAVGAWVQRRWPPVALLSLVIAVGILAYLHRNRPEGLEPVDIPNAFLTVLARVLN